MGPEERVTAYNKAFPKYPPLMYAKGWIYGIWYCGTSFQKAKIYGQYPSTYLKRILSMFPDIDEGRIIQPCAGSVTGPGITVDLSPEFDPAYVADVQEMPFLDDAFELAIIDPPYGKEHAEVYGLPMLSYKKTLTELRRVLMPGGIVVWLDNKYPAYARHNWKLIGLIGVVTGFLRMMRVASIFESTKGSLPKAEQMVL